MDQMIAFCGLVCTDCPAYKATQADDAEALARVAAEWREAFNMPHITAESVICDGCLRTDGRLSGYCSQCEVRACAVKREMANCAHCTEFETCEKLAAFHVHAPEAKALLQQLRRAL